MMYLGNIAMSTFAIVVDNCKMPAASLLQRLRTREMMELSASRWDPTPSSSAATPNSPSYYTEEPGSTSTLGPKVPRRQISPPAKKRDSSSPKQDRPNKPVRSRSPLVLQPRSLLGADDKDESCSSLDASFSLLPVSPMLPSRQLHHHPRHPPAPQQHQQQYQQPHQFSPRMPERKSSLLHRHHQIEQQQQELSASAAAAQIQRILEDNDDDDDPEDRLQEDSCLVPDGDNDQEEEEEDDRKPPARPSLKEQRQSSFVRQSSFEILPATLPTRQSSFELRHRTSKKASPLSQRAVAKILEVHPPKPTKASPRRAKSDSLSILVDENNKETLTAGFPDLHTAKDDEEVEDNDSKEEEDEGEEPHKNRQGTTTTTTKSSTNRHRKLHCGGVVINRRWSFHCHSEFRELSPNSSSSSSKNRFLRYRTTAATITSPSLPVRNSSFEQQRQPSPSQSSSSSSPPQQQTTTDRPRSTFTVRVPPVRQSSCSGM